VSTAPDATARSYLYVPGDRPERFAKALASGTDAVILDLEDAVALPAKDAARENVLGALTEGAGADAGGPQVWVRVNQGERGLADLAALDGAAGLTGVFLPKASTASVTRAVAALGATPAVALVESAATVLELPALARSVGLVALAMGEVDLAADLGIDASDDGAELWPVRLSAVVASVAAGLAPLIGPVWVAVRDLDGLATSTVELRRRGFGARQIIHPDQVGPVNAAFTPTAEDVERARALLEGAGDAGNGAWVGPDGKMVDEAVLRSARRTVELADRRL
jgi:citrate lyase subunit beta / citryl-CoA lyase